MRVPPTEPVEILHIALEDPDHLRLEIYYSDPVKKAVWDSLLGSTPASAAQLAPRESYLLSGDWRLLGVRNLIPFPPGSNEPSGATQATELTFLTGPPGVQPPPPLSSAWEIQPSDTGEVLLYTQRPREGDGPSQTEVFAFDPQNQGFYQATGSYQNAEQGSIEPSGSGRLIAQQDGAQVRILTHTGDQRGSTAAGIGFALSRDGRVLAVREASAVRFLPLDSDGTPLPAQETQLAVQRPPLDVALADRWAVVITRSAVHLVDWTNGVQAWRRDVTQGDVASADLFSTPGGDLLVAIGRLEVQQRARRTGGAIDWGGALGHVDLVDGQNQAVVATHTFRTMRWTFDAPRVRILPASRRVLVRSLDVVLASDPLSKGLFQ